MDKIDLGIYGFERSIGDNNLTHDYPKEQLAEFPVDNKTNLHDLLGVLMEIEQGEVKLPMITINPNAPDLANSDLIDGET